MIPTLSEREFWIAWGLVRGLNLRLRVKLLEVFSSPAAVFQWAHTNDSRISDPKGTLVRVKHRIRDFNFSEMDQELQRIKRLGATLLAFSDPQYPSSLKHLYDPPAFIIFRGARFKEVFENPDYLAVVGSRKASAYGKAMTHSLVWPLAQSGMVIVSGGARGIDACAHKACLEAGGQTIVVLGSGLGQIYPLEHRSLFKKISERGMVLSEFACNEVARPYYFPQRNRIIAALSKGILVTEAGLKSGALITAKIALEMGREIMAVPGLIHHEGARGTHQLIKDGAFLVETSQDIRGIMGDSRKSIALDAFEPNPCQSRILEQMGTEAISRQSLFNRCGLQILQFNEQIAEMKKAHWIIPLPGDRWIRSVQGSEQLWHRH